jgi:hypothetical protein
MAKGAGFVSELVALAALSPASGRKQKVQKQTHSAASALNSQRLPNLLNYINEPTGVERATHQGLKSQKQTHFKVQENGWCNAAKS